MTWRRPISSQDSPSSATDERPRGHCLEALMTRVQATFCRGITVLLLGWIGACGEALIPPECVKGEPECEEDTDPVGCVCQDIYKPVCGENGKTYGNAC